MDILRSALVTDTSPSRQEVSSSGETNGQRRVAAGLAMPKHELRALALTRVMVWRTSHLQYSRVLMDDASVGKKRERAWS